MSQHLNDMPRNRGPMRRTLKSEFWARGASPIATCGFEHCCRIPRLGLTARGHDVWVYNSDLHEFRGPIWNGTIRSFSTSFARLSMASEYRLR